MPLCAWVLLMARKGKNMRSIVFIAVTVCILMIAQIDITYAGGYESPTLGSRVLGMGSAFIGTADDWTAIYWNPAGLAQQESWELGATLCNPRYTLTDGNSISNYDGPKMSFYQRDVFMRVHPTLSGVGSEETQFSKKKANGSAYSPGVGGYWAIPEVGVLGVGFYTPVANRTKWDDVVSDPATQADVAASYASELSMNVANLSFARYMTPNLSAGIGLNLVYGDTELDASKEYISAAAPPMNYTFDYGSEASGTGFEWMLGLHYKVIPQLSVGAVYRSGSKLDLSGTASAYHTMLGIDETSDYNQNFYHPATYGVGIAYRPIPELLLGVDWAQADWTTMKAQIDYESEGAILSDVDKSMDWERSDTYRMGAEYAIGGRITLQAGYSKALSAVPDSGISLTNVNEVDKDIFSVGAGYAFKGPQINAAYLYVGGTRMADSVEYEIEANIFVLTCTYGL